MRSSIRSNSVSARTIMAGVWGTLCVLIIAAPFLLSHSCRRAAAFLYLFFSCMCHQIPGRSFIFSGHPLAVCHRCSGIYLGLFLGSLVENRFVFHSPRARRWCVIAASAPLLFDILAPHLGLWISTDLSRFFTGLLFGGLAASLLVCGVTELLNEVPAPGRRALQSAIRISREAFHE
jgi:uncharacterized membrane protein